LNRQQGIYNKTRNQYNTKNLKKFTVQAKNLTILTTPLVSMLLSTSTITYDRLLKSWSSWCQHKKNNRFWTKKG